MATVACRRCQRPDAPALERPPLPGPAGEEIRAAICRDCWAEWTKMEVVVINELRLNFMDPAAPAILEHHMREFLTLEPPSAAPPADEPKRGG